jgi:hypothetical protein
MERRYQTMNSRKSIAGLTGLAVALLIISSLAPAAVATPPGRWMTRQARQQKAVEFLDRHGLVKAHPSAKQKLIDNGIAVARQLPTQNIRVSGWNDAKLWQFLGDISRNESVFGYQVHSNGHPYFVAQATNPFGRGDEAVVFDTLMTRGRASVRTAALDKYMPRAHDKSGRILMFWFGPKDKVKAQGDDAMREHRTHRDGWPCSLFAATMAHRSQHHSTGDPNAPLGPALNPYTNQTVSPPWGFTSWSTPRDTKYRYGQNWDLVGARLVMTKMARQAPDLVIQVLRPVDWDRHQAEIQDGVAPAHIPFGISGQRNFHEATR